MTGSKNGSIALTTLKSALELLEDNDGYLPLVALLLQMGFSASYANQSTGL